MAHSDSSPDKYVLARLAGRLYGVPSTFVAEMIQLPPLRALPRMPHYVRGAFILRQQSIMALDLRALFGLESLVCETNDFRGMLQQREQDHRNWIAELEASVREERPFTLATDPHKCAFGRWYDSFTSDSVLIDSHLRNFDAPHKKIHALAEKVQEQVLMGNKEQALELIDVVRETELRRMIDLFGQFDQLLDESNREIVIVLSVNLDESGAAYCVDSVEGVVDRSALDFGAEGIGDGPSRLSGLDERGLTAALHRSSRELVLLIDEERMPGLAMV